MATNFRVVGIQSTADAAKFLISDWVNLSGMNNCLMYGVGCWSANSAGGVNASPYNGNIIYSTADSVSGTTVGTASSSSFQANGAIVTSPSYPPTRGHVYVMYGNVDGENSQRVFQANVGIPENTQTWKSYVAHNAMWVGDTPTKRLFFVNNGSVFSQALDLKTMASLAGSSNPLNPNVVGTNFGNTYTESVSASPSPTPSPI